MRSKKQKRLIMDIKKQLLIYKIVTKGANLYSMMKLKNLMTGKLKSTQIKNQLIGLKRIWTPLILAIAVGFLSGWTLKPPKKVMVVGDIEYIDRPVEVIKIVYKMPSVICPTPEFNGRVGGYTMPELIVWGKNAWLWISICHNSLLENKQAE